MRNFGPSFEAIKTGRWGQDQFRLRRASSTDFTLEADVRGWCPDCKIEVNGNGTCPVCGIMYGDNELLHICPDDIPPDEEAVGRGN